MNVELTESANIENGCASEGCFADDGSYNCPLNSTCVGSLGATNLECTCNLGYRGDDCSEGTTH